MAGIKIAHAAYSPWIIRLDRENPLQSERQESIIEVPIPLPEPP